MASPTWWTWVWASSRSWWWTGKSGVLQSMGSQRVGHDWATELSWTEVPYIWTFKLWNFKDVNVHTINVGCVWNCSFPSISYSQWSFSSTISNLLSLLQSVTLLACALDARPCIPAVVLYYCTFQGTIRFKMFSFFVFAFNVLFVWKVV